VSAVEDPLTATVRCEFDGHTTEQRISARDTDDHRLAELAAAAGLRAESPLTADATLVLLCTA
jgi:hypothetical protein